ncbi:MAG: hypothetical protein CXZ00_12435 [Acidobacteria bacterium]|nr:MAG: hypothetical protein CXZ00_12435 [Acidobacteriota bacterium]
MSSPALSLDRGLPAAPEIERVLLGAILVNPELIFEALAKLRMDDFYLDAHRRIFTRLCAMHDAGQPIEEMALVEELRDRTELDAVGGVGYIAGLTTGVVKRSSLAYHIELIRKKSRQRSIIHASNAALEAALEEGGEPEMIAAQLQDTLLELQTSGEGPRPIGAVMTEAVQRLQRLQERDAGDCLGLTTTIPSIDEATTAIRDSEFWIVGARPNVGKTPFGCQIAIANAKRGIPVLVFSLEMDEIQLAWRTLSHAGFAKPAVVRDPRYALRPTWEAITSAPTAVASWPLFIDATPGISISEIRHRTRFAVAKHGIRLVVIDYVQLVSASGKGGYERVSNVARGLQRLCRETRCPILALSQLNREAKDLSREPMLGDLRESGELEQNANVVLLLHRPPCAEDSTPGREGKIIAAKVREGRGGAVNVFFDEKTLTFQEHRS